QFIDFSGKHEAQQDPGAPTPVASFSVTLLGAKPDKIGKDDNFRGMTVFNNVLYYTKGSGSNGVNTVYFVDTTGKACPNGVGLPAANGQLPATPLAFDPAALQTTGLPSNMCILAGFPTALAKTANPVAFPFALWFANPTTLYVADEGDGFASDSTLYTHAAAQTTAGLQKWVFNNVLYYTKGSGSNGVNTVYFVDTTGKACPNGVGLPAANAKLPTTPLTYDPASLQTTGLPSNMCILAGFPTALAKTAKVVAFPFALWFANPTTLYVADEGDGFASDSTLYTHAAAQTTAGLQKWVLNTTTNTWNLAYTLTNGLQLGAPYTVNGYPTGINTATSLPWAPATDGLRNIQGQVNRDGTVTIWAITSTISGGGDTGADPNRLVVINDSLANTNTSVATKESFSVVRQAGFAEVLRGVAFAPGTSADDNQGQGR
ncbi:MAG TPA: hypothetical protein VGM02_04915, partial [Acidobacteriaceae bacterium]